MDIHFLADGKLILYMKDYIEELVGFFRTEAITSEQGFAKYK